MYTLFPPETDFTVVHQYYLKLASTNHLITSSPLKSYSRTVSFVVILKLKNPTDLNYISNLGVPSSQ